MITSSSYSRRRPTGFSLSEMLVVMAVISVLLALSMPALNSIRDNARAVTCANNMRQVAIGLTTYEKEYRTFPPGNAQIVGQTGAWLWPAFILPQLDNMQLYKKLDFKKGTLSQSSDDKKSIDPGGQYPLNVVLPFFVCPSVARTEKGRTDNRLDDDGAGHSLGAMDYAGISAIGNKLINPRTKGSYSQNGATEGVLQATLPINLSKGATAATAIPRTTTKSIRDGLSKTILISECTGRGGFHGAWAMAQISPNTSLVTITSAINAPPNYTDINKGYPYAADLAWSNDQLYSDHRAGGVNGAFCDTSVQFLRDTMDVSVLAALVSRNGGEIVGPSAGDWLLADPQPDP